MNDFDMTDPLVDQEFLMQKIPGKGVWTDADLPQIRLAGNSPFGWVKVKGTIDGVAIRQYHLMPFGGGRLFLPVEAQIRRKIGKEAGDPVHVILYPDHDRVELPTEMPDCLRDEPGALRFFNSLEEDDQVSYIKWVYADRREATRVQRLAGMIEKLLQGRKCHEA